MCHTKSPAKILRDAKRMAKYNELQKLKSNEIHTKMSIISTSLIDIPPSEVIPKKKQTLTLFRCSQTDLAPDPLPCIYCKLVSPFPNLPRTPTGPVPMCCVCTKPVDERFDPHFCCDQVIHPLCLGGHLCDDWD